MRSAQSAIPTLQSQRRERETDMGARAERSDTRRNMERVLLAARELFAERGPDVTMCEVAARAGVGVGTIYRRFPSKELLFAAVSAAACADTSSVLAQAACDAGAPADKLRAVIVAQYRRSLHHAALLDAPPAEDEQDHRGLYPALHALVAEVIAEGQRQGQFRPGDPALLAALSLEILTPRAVRRLCRAAGGCDSAAHRAADFILAGLGAR
jgi:AcrR family transcriptional regulator